MENEKNKTPQSCNIDSVIASADFLKKLKDAIEYGKETDYTYDAENNQYEIETFNSDSAVDEVLELLKSHLL